LRETVGRLFFFNRDQNRKWKKYARGLFYIAFLVIHTTGHTTESEIPPNVQDSIRTNYMRGLNTELWEWGFDYGKAISPVYLFNIGGTLSSSRLLVTSTGNKWKDKHLFNMELQRILNPNFSTRFLIDSFFLSDKQSGYLDTLQNDIQTHSVGFGASYKNRGLNIPCSISLKEDRRMGQTDRGLNTKIGMNYRNFKLGSYNNGLSVDYETDHLDQRNNTTFTVSCLFDRQFYENTGDTLKANVYHQRRDYYISMYGDIESRTESGQHIENTLTYYVGSGISCLFYGSLFNRTQRYSQITGTEKGLKRIRTDFQAEGTARLLWKTSLIRTVLDFRYASEDQKYESGVTSLSSKNYSAFTLIAPDNRGTYTNLNLGTQWRISHADSLGFFAGIQRYRYDTPDPENFDDRDELRYRFQIQEIHTFSPELRLRTLLNLNLLHFVYIFGERSADNNWTRILSFSPSVLWTPSSKVRMTQTAEVLVNTVDFDYEALDPTVKSYLYRKLSIEDSLRIQLSSKTSVHLYYEFEWDENGKFLWKDWLEQKLIDRKNQNFSIYLNYCPWRCLKLVSGYSLYFRQGYRYAIGLDNEQQKERTINFRSYGPTLRLEYFGKRLALFINGNIIGTRILDQKKHVLTRLDLNMSWKL